MSTIKQFIPEAILKYKAIEKRLTDDIIQVKKISESKARTKLDLKHLMMELVYMEEKDNIDSDNFEEIKNTHEEAIKEYTRKLVLEEHKTKTIQLLFSGKLAPDQEEVSPFDKISHPKASSLDVKDC